MKKLILLMFFAAHNLIAAEGEAAPTPEIKAPPAYPTDLRVEPDVAYLSPERKEKADLYFSNEMKSGQRVPAIVVIHGGGFNDGDKAQKRQLSICSDLGRHGFVTMSINYKLAKVKGKATWPISVYDAKTAVRWLRKNAERLGIDADKIGVLGGSAGGNLAAMLAVTTPEDGFDPAEPYGDVSARVACAVDLYGAVDLMNYHDMKMFAKTREEAPELYRKASPLTYAKAQAAPMLIIHGTADETVALSQSETLTAALKKAGADVELVVIPDAPHSFDLQPPQRDLRPLVFAFFDKHLTSSRAAQTP